MLIIFITNKIQCYQSGLKQIIHSIGMMKDHVTEVKKTLVLDDAEYHES